MDVYQQIQQKMQSKFSLHRWLGSTVWGTLVKEIRALNKVGTYSLPLAARFDKAAFDIYGEPRLDWVLLVYNSIRAMGTFEGRDVQETFVLTIDPGVARTEDLQLTSDNFDLYTWDSINEEWVINRTRTTYAQGFYYDLNADGLNDLQISTVAAGAVFTNTGTAQTTFRLSYNRIEFSDLLDAGEDISYPSLAALEALFASGQIEKSDKEKYYGFKRL